MTCCDNDLREAQQQLEPRGHRASDISFHYASSPSTDVPDLGLQRVMDAWPVLPYETKDIIRTIIERFQSPRFDRFFEPRIMIPRDGLANAFPGGNFEHLPTEVCTYVCTHASVNAELARIVALWVSMPNEKSEALLAACGSGR